MSTDVQTPFLGTPSVPLKAEVMAKVASQNAAAAGASWGAGQWGGKGGQKGGPKGGPKGKGHPHTAKYGPCSPPVAPVYLHMSPFMFRHSPG